MKSMSELVEDFMKEKISDSKLLRKEICEGCKREVEVYEYITAFGPNKGNPFEEKVGCICWELHRLEEDRRYAQEAMMNRLNEIFEKNSLINSNLQKATFDNYNPTNPVLSKVKEEVMRYVETFDEKESKNLLLFGAYGLGKSHLAAAATKDLMQKGERCIFISVPKLLSKIRSTYNKRSEYSEEDLMKWLERVEFLVLDDVGAEQRKANDDGESWAVSKLFEIIDSRAGKHTIYTTNLNSGDLQRAVGPRNFSRMMQDTIILKLEGKDFRLKDF